MHEKYGKIFRIAYIESPFAALWKGRKREGEEDVKDMLNKNKALLHQYSLDDFPKWTMCHITGMREMMMTFQGDITLDPETVNPYLIVSADLKSVKHSCVPQDVLDHSERFNYSATVLSTQRFTSSIHYWGSESDKHD
ncbi:putative E3 ubiquitin-protein ligase TRIML1 [Sarcophilus harrisii]